MDITINQLDGATRELIISIPKSEFEEKLNEQFLEAQKYINLKGFRPGKAPIKLIKSLYGKEIEQDFIGDYATEVFQKAVDSKEIQFVGKQTLKQFQKEDEKVTFTFQYDIIPDFTLKEYKGLKIYEPIHRVTDEEIEHEILHRRLHSAQVLKADEIANEFFIVSVDIFKIDQTTKEPIPEVPPQTTTILLHSETVPTDLRNLFIGRKTGDSFLYNPHEMDSSAENEEVLIKIKEVHQLVLEDFDDEFVKRYTNGRLSTTDEFKEEIGYSLQEKWDLRSNDEMVKQVIKQLVESHEFDLPTSVVYETAMKLSEDFIKKYSDRYPALKGKKPSDVLEDFVPIAISQVKWAIIKKKIIEKENIQLEDYDIDSLVQEYKMQNPNLPEEEIKSYILNNKHITDTLLEKKVLDFLIGFAETIEIDFDEYEKLQEETEQEEAENESDLNAEEKPLESSEQTTSEIEPSQENEQMTSNTEPEEIENESDKAKVSSEVSGLNKE